MLRIAKKPIAIPTGVDVSISESIFNAKGPKGTIRVYINQDVGLKKTGNDIVLEFIKNSENISSMLGTAAALIKCAFIGVTKGFERKLVLVGVGFKAQVQGKVLNLSLGFSHPIKFNIPTGITIETPSQTEIIVKGVDKCMVGQVASEIRSFRPPEPYKGKGIRYENEVIVKKEGKKK